MATYKKGKATQLSENFSSAEMDCHGLRCCDNTVINPQLIEYLQIIRNHFGAPITINSGYRCTIHNRNVGGATNSRHTKGDAADIVVRGVAPKEVAKYAESIGIKGIGLYETASDGHFVHIDTRETKSFWYGQKEESRTTFGGSTASSDPAPSAPAEITLDLPTLSVGSKGDLVKVVQALLNTAPDGSFGNNTKTAVSAYQSKKGLKADGIVGDATWDSLLQIDEGES